jgi:hypothetical protein
MHWITRLIGTILFLIVLSIITQLVFTAYYPQITMRTAVDQLKDSDEAFINLRAGETGKNALFTLFGVVGFLGIVLFWMNPIKKMLVKTKNQWAKRKGDEQ